MTEPYKAIRVKPSGHRAVDSITALIIGKTGKRHTINDALVEAERILRETVEADRKSA